MVPLTMSPDPKTIPYTAPEPDCFIHPMLHPSSAGSILRIFVFRNHPARMMPAGCRFGYAPEEASWLVRSSFRRRRYASHSSSLMKEYIYLYETRVSQSLMETPSGLMILLPLFR